MTTTPTKADLQKRLSALQDYKWSLMRINEQSMAADIEMGKVLDAETKLRAMLKEATL